MKYFPKLRISKIHLTYLLILLAVFLTFLILAFLNIQVKKQISQINLSSIPLTFTQQKYPQISNIYDPNISAKGAVVIDKNSQVPLYEKNSKLRFPPASTTKIMTALVALDYYKLDDPLFIKTPIVEGSVIGFKPNEEFKFEDLLYAMLLPSANDATLAIAENYPGGESGFVTKMNEKAKEFNLLNTVYVDPIGLDDEKDYTTPIDLARLTAIALQNPVFAKAVSTKSKQIKSTQGNSYILYSLNKLLDIPGVNGVKTGHTEGAGDVLVTSRRIDNNQDLIFVVMQSEDRFKDTEILLNYLNQNITYLSIHP